MQKVKVNDKLKDSILSTIPENYSNLEKALYIYKQLCTKLQYSMDYFIDERSVKTHYTNIDNLQLVDGETNKDVVCFTFNAILGELLLEANVCERINFDYGRDTNRFSFVHDSVYVTIDGKEYDIDATYGILDNNDLTLSKYSSHRPKGWIACDNNQEAKESLDSAIDKVYSTELEQDKNVSKYVSLKQEEGSYLHLPFSDRVNLFFKMMKDAPDYSIVSFNYLLKLKHMLFKNEEFGNNGIDKMVDLQFVKDKETNTLKALLFVNPKGYTNDMGYENFDNLSIYEIDMRTKSVESIGLETAKERISKRHYISHRDDKTLSYFSMMSEGKLYIRPVTNGEKPIYDHHQNVVNAIGYERKILKEDRYVPYEMGDGV